MKYYLDTEFLEGKQDKRFLGIKIGETKPTIDMISIGIVGEDGREFYAVSKDFNLHEAWNRYDLVQQSGDMRNHFPEGKKVYWIRENVLKPIYYEFIGKDINFHDYDKNFTYKEFARLLRKYGKSNDQIAKEIKEFTHHWNDLDSLVIPTSGKAISIEFYAYFADYDHVCFCWIFGKMMDLPKGFPRYCRDLKQMLDEKVSSLDLLYGRDVWSNKNRSIYSIGKGDQQEKDRPATFEEKLKTIKKLEEYPQQENEHNALSDARWNLALHKFINSL